MVEQLQSAEAERRREMRIRAGEDILLRAMRAKADGKIKDFHIFAQAEDPAVIDHILIER